MIFSLKYFMIFSLEYFSIFSQKYFLVFSLKYFVVMVFYVRNACAGSSFRILSAGSRLAVVATSSRKMPTAT